MTASRLRLFVALLFALLLLGMQHQVQVHALQHFNGLFHAKHDLGLQAPVADASCLECALLAAGTSGIVGDNAASVVVARAIERVRVSIETRRLVAPSYYSTRAPPSLL